jgi:hypothetical protein
MAPLRRLLFLGIVDFYMNRGLQFVSLSLQFVSHSMVVGPEHSLLFKTPEASNVESGRTMWVTFLLIAMVKCYLCTLKA